MAEVIRNKRCSRYLKPRQPSSYYRQVPASSSPSWEGSKQAPTPCATTPARATAGSCSCSPTLYASSAPRCPSFSQRSSSTAPAAAATSTCRPQEHVVDTGHALRGMYVGKYQPKLNHKKPNLRSTDRGDNRGRAMQGEGLRGAFASRQGKGTQVNYLSPGMSARSGCCPHARSTALPPAVPAALLIAVPRRPATAPTLPSAARPESQCVPCSRLPSTSHALLPCHCNLFAVCLGYGHQLHPTGPRHLPKSCPITHAYPPPVPSRPLSPSAYPPHQHLHLGPLHGVLRHALEPAAHTADHRHAARGGGGLQVPQATAGARGLARGFGGRHLPRPEAPSSSGSRADLVGCALALGDPPGLAGPFPAPAAGPSPPPCLPPSLPPPSSLTHTHAHTRLRALTSSATVRPTPVTRSATSRFFSTPVFAVSCTRLRLWAVVRAAEGRSGGRQGGAGVGKRVTAVLGVARPCRTP